MEANKLTISILGGTGKEGKGLAYRWAKAGFRVIIGSRSREKAEAAVLEIAGMLPDGYPISGQENLSAAENANIVILTVPFSAHRATLEYVKHALQGKLLIDVTVPLMPPKVSRVQMPASGSATQEAREILGEGVEVCSAFQNISHEHLLSDEEINCDVLVTGSSKAAREETIRLVELAGLKGWDAGSIENSVVVEGLTSVLIGINKKYGSTNAGIKITGVSQ